jgi:FkbM family methyltransferase
MYSDRARRRSLAEFAIKRALHHTGAIAPQGRSRCSSDAMYYTDLTMKIFLDVGANTGQTARAALDPRYGFDRIVCFEPAPECWAEIEAIADSRVQLCRFGLWKQTCRRELHDPGTQAASIFADFENADRTFEATTVDLVSATDWLAPNAAPGDIVFMKLNCEGSECDIVDDLLDGGGLGMVYNLMIAFDVRKSPSQRGREVQVRRRLRRAGYTNVAFSEDVMRGTTHADRIHHWLTLVGAHEPLPLDELRDKYAPVLADLSHRTGRLMRFEQTLRTRVLAHLPAPLRRLARRVWSRAMRGRRPGPE